MLLSSYSCEGKTWPRGVPLLGFRGEIWGEWLPELQPLLQKPVVAVE